LVLKERKKVKGEKKGKKQGFNQSKKQEPIALKGSSGRPRTTKNQ